MKRGIRILAFLLVFACAYLWLDGVVKTKSSDGIGTMSRFYQLPEDTVDVLLVGSSHMGMNVDPLQMLQENGIAAYSLWGGMQPVWNSYYFIKEGLKYQTPEVVVLEVFLGTNTNEMSESSVALKNVQAMRLSMDKIRAALDSFPTWQQAVEAVWGMPTYHERFDELTKSDFTYRQDMADNDLGVINQNNMLTMDRPPYVLTLPNTDAVTDTLPLSDKTDKYLRKIISMCRSKDVEIVFMLAPFEATDDEYRRANRMAQIAAEYDVPFLNFIADADKYGIDTQTDFHDVGHLNATGIPKLTRALGDFLAASFDLPDRRKDAGHIWADDVQAGANASAADWEMTEQFSGDGLSRFIDTEKRLYENRYGSWTVLAQIEMDTHGGDEVFFSCFNEEPGTENYGLLARKQGEDRVEVKIGPNIGVELVCTEDVLNLAVVKEVEAYTVYANGEAIVSRYELPCPPYTGTLLIGCQELSPDGERFRYSTTTLRDLEIFDRALRREDVLAWEAQQLPEMKMPMGMEGESKVVFTLPEQFMGDSSQYDQADYLDTGVRLYDEAANRFTLLARITPGAMEGDTVFFSSFSEEENAYRGLLVRQSANDRLTFVVGDNHGIDLPCAIGETVDIAIVKDIDTYTIYMNGEMAAADIVSPCLAYDGTLLVGAQHDAEGNVFRKSSKQVNSLTIVSGVMDDQAIRAWDYSDAALPGQRMASSVNYVMDAAFMGNGQDRWVDTGAMLFDLPGKDWTLDTTIETEYGVNNGVYMSCFSEEAGAYRGFMLRQDDETSLTLFVGNAATHRIALSETEKMMHLVVVKRGSRYDVYLNGKQETTIDSACRGYNGTLLVGCQETAEGELFRFSTAKVRGLMVMDGALDEAEASKLSQPVQENSRF